MESEFIDNRHFDRPAGTGSEQRKQDWLKAFARLAAQLKRDFPQLSLCLCLAADALMARGPVFQICQENRWHYVLTFKEGSLPAMWEDFQALLTLCPQQVRRLTTPDQRELEYRRVNGLSYVDDEGREHTFGLPAIPAHPRGGLRAPPADSDPTRLLLTHFAIARLPPHRRTSFWHTSVPLLLRMPIWNRGPCAPRSPAATPPRPPNDGGSPIHHRWEAGQPVARDEGLR